MLFTTELQLIFVTKKSIIQNEYSFEHQKDNDDLVVGDGPDDDVVVLPVAVHTLHHRAKLCVEGEDAVLDRIIQWIIMLKLTEWNGL